MLGNICWHKNNISKKIRSVRLCEATVKSDRKSPDVFNYLRSFPDYTNFILCCTLSQQDYIFLSVCSLFIIERLFKKIRSGQHLSGKDLPYRLKVSLELFQSISSGYFGCK